MAAGIHFFIPREFRAWTFIGEQEYLDNPRPTVRTLLQSHDRHREIMLIVGWGSQDPFTVLRARPFQVFREFRVLRCP